MILNLFIRKKSKGYTKLSSAEKKKLIEKAARGANIMQKNLIDRYWATYPQQA